MGKEEIIERLEEIAKHAVHVLGEKAFFMSLDDGIAIHEAIDILKSAQTVDAVSVIRCKDCKHRPIKDGEFVDAPKYHDGFSDEICPCLCGDRYYSWMPEDDFFCKRGERRSE